MNIYLKNLSIIPLFLFNYHFSRSLITRYRGFCVLDDLKHDGSISSVSEMSQQYCQTANLSQFSMTIAQELLNSAIIKFNKKIWQITEISSHTSQKNSQLAVCMQARAPMSLSPRDILNTARNVWVNLPSYMYSIPGCSEFSRISFCVAEIYGVLATNSWTLQASLSSTSGTS